MLKRTNSAWLGTVNRHAAIARRFEDWVSLASHRAAYDPLTTSLNVASAEIVMAEIEIESLAALDRANDAIDATAQVLDANPCGHEPGD